MNNLIKIVSAIIVLCVCSSSAGAEEWTYTGYYPYVYTPSSDTWYYLPDSPPLVWDYSAGEWVTNPLGGRAFDLEAVFSQTPLQFKLDVSGGQSQIEVSFNYSGIEGGYYTVGTVTHAIDVSYEVDATAGRCVLYGMWAEDDGTGSFCLQLNFDTALTGSYSLMGSIGVEWAQIATYKGDFVLELSPLADE